MKIEFNRKYRSSLIANTELHAGGLFFCIIYQNQLEFFENGKIELTKRVVNPLRPMDENDVKHLENYKIIGKYSFNDRGYLICVFEDLFLTYTGFSTSKNEGVIPFHIYDSRLSKHWSEVFQIEST